MYREAVARLESWFNEKERKPLLITGARSVGKTWIARDFGDAFFDQTIIIDFIEDKEFLEILEQELDKNQISRLLANRIGKKIDPKVTLIIFDNLHLLKAPEQLFHFFKEKMPEYFVCGVSYIKPEELFVTGNPKDLAYVKEIHPLTFGEFLIANKENEICSLIENHKENPLDKEKLFYVEELLRSYYIVGGMPEVVKSWVEERDFDLVNNIKKSILNRYLNDFREIPSKAEQKKVFEIWNSITRQLDREVKKFHYDIVRLTARKREYAIALTWLIERQYLSILPNINKKESFEVFLPDVGLLSLMFGKNYKDLNQGKKSLLCNNSALTEQFVFQELKANDSIDKLYYWNSKATARIEFLFEDSGEMIPIEINIDLNKKSQSLKVFREKYKNSMSIRITNEDFGVEAGVLNIPLYAVWNL